MNIIPPMGSLAALAKPLLVAGLIGLISFQPVQAQTNSRELLVQALDASTLRNHKQAELLYRQIIDIRKQNENASDVDLLEIILALALEISAQGRYEESKLLLKRAEVALGILKGSPIHARYLSALAIDHGNRQEYDLALGNIQQATTIRRRYIRNNRSASSINTSTTGLPELAHGLLIEARLHLRMDAPDKARLATDLARKVIVNQDGAPAWWLAKVEELVALIEKEERKYDAAEGRLRRSIAIQRQRFGETRPVAENWISLGETQHDSGANTDAVKSLRLGLNIIEDNMKQGQSAGLDQVLIFLNAAWKEAGLRPAERDVLKAEMFAVSQLAREGQTARTIAGMVARLSAGDSNASNLVRDAQEKGRLRDNLRLELGREVSRPQEERQEGRLEQLKAAYVQAQQEAEQLNAELRTAIPNYDQIVQSGPVELAEIQAVLKEGEALYVPVPGPKDSFAFLVTRDGLAVKPVSHGLPDIAKKIEDLRLAFDVSSGNLREFNLPLAHEMWQILFGGMEDSLSGISNISLVPKGPLLSMPFGMLVTEKPTGTNNYHQTAWFAKRYASSLSPSIRSFLNFRRLNKPSRAARDLIGFGNPVFVGKDGSDSMDDLAHECRPDGKVPLEMVRALAPLPDTQSELETVSAILGEGSADLIFGNAADENRVRQSKLNDYKVVYFATHGLLPSELACQSEPALALTTPDSFIGDDNDGLLTSSEVLDLELDADLVILSACNTGGGDGKFGGESLSGLARAFFYAGARSLLVSHWQVSSEDTANLMTGMFRVSNANMGDALRQSQLAFMSDPEKAHPFFWAPFTLVGDGAKQLRLQTGPAG